MTARNKRESTRRRAPAAAVAWSAGAPCQAHIPSRSDEPGTYQPRWTAASEVPTETFKSRVRRAAAGSQINAGILDSG